MSDHVPEIANCHACGAAMDVSALRPFTKCICPTCGVEGRVKRDFGHYTLMRRHAEGGMSSVFGAHDNTLDREVAIKVLNTTYSSDEKRIAAFEHEAKLTASLSHPHIVKVYTTGRAYGCFYIAMEFVSGGHLEQIIRTRGKIPEQETLVLAIQIAEGLRAAHSSGLLHRDIKPGNILLDSQGHAKLVDFGLSLVTQGGKATAEEIWATPYYVPPETIDGMEEDLRSDIYAFGCTLYHALAGVPPCSETTMQAEKLKTAKRNIIPLALAEPSISKETTKVVDKAISYDTADRYQSYDELLSALNRALSYAKSGRHESTDRAEQRKALLQKKRRSQQILTTSAVIGAILLTAGALAMLGRNRKPSDGPQIPPSQQGKTNGRDTAAELARSYGKARAALQNREDETAADLFSKLLGHPDFQEPSRTMAGVESILAAYLDGNTRTAQDNARALLIHLRNSSIGRNSVNPALTNSINQLQQLEPMVTPAMPKSPSAQDVIAAMLAGLKNWEQGMLADAVKNFRALTSITLDADDQWAGIYQERARDYLRDYDILTSPIFNAYPSSPSACRNTVTELDELRKKLKTRGRARFNIAAWKTDIERHGRILEKPPSNHTNRPHSSGSSDPYGTMVDHIRNYRFSQASRIVRDMRNDPPDINRQSLLYACKYAADFLRDLDDDLSRKKLIIDIELISGTKANSIVRNLNGNLEVGTSNGNQKISWPDLSADSLNAIHRQLVRGSLSEGETLRRHECAIWFDWLAGDRTRATRAAAIVGESNGEFLERWTRLTNELKGLKS